MQILFDKLKTDKYEVVLCCSCCCCCCFDSLWNQLKMFIYACICSQL